MSRSRSVPEVREAHSRTAARPARFFVWLYGAALVVLCALGFLFERMGNSARIDEPTDFDNFVHAWVIQHRADWPALTLLFRAATLFGNPDIATTATAVITFGLYALHRRGLARVRKAETFVWLGAILGGRLLSIGMKIIFQRERPPIVHRLVPVPESSYSFPSGHSVFAAVFFAMLAYVLVRTIPATHVWMRVLAAIWCVFLAILVAVSRVWLGVHYPTDVMGGLLLGVGWVVTVWLIRVGWDHWRDHSLRNA